MFATIRKLLEMIRFSHTVFALPFALLAAVMAWKETSSDFAKWALPFPAWHWQQLLGILLCMVFARSAAMAFNRIADRRIDAANPRTATRHLPSGSLSLGTVAAFAVLASIGFVASTLLFLPDNRLPLYLSLPVLAFLMGYSYAKRFTALAHFWLGAALMMAPLAAWIAIRGQIVLAQPADILPALVLGGAVLFWVAGFDIIYACQDAEFDRGQRLRSVPARLGVPVALRIAAACHAGTVAMLALLPLVFPYFGWIYWLGVAVIAGLLIYEHWIVRPDDLTRVNVAFFHVNAVISLGLLLVATADLMWHSAVR
ncbi:MAG: putative 4-hydroxybenzoate polyprenyltransferase [Planctomycetia bacterium]|nr:putative 4-hydroxybenzoate polyprenyltransferase [Planctomycetia bacterium]